MMFFGYFGLLLRDYWEKHFHQGSQISPGQAVLGSNFGVFDLFLALLFLSGMFICLISSLWILIAVIITFFRQKHPKQV